MITPEFPQVKQNQNNDPNLALPAVKVLDAEIFASLDQPLTPDNAVLGTIQDAETATYKLLGPSSQAVETEHQQFLDANKTALPDLRPSPDLNLNELNAWEAQLLGIKTELLASDMQTDTKQLYRWRINENIANLRIIRAAANGDTRRFERYNSFIYGQPDPDIFHAVADRFCSDAEAASTSDRPELQQAASQVLEQLSQYRVSGKQAVLTPSTDTFQAIKADYTTKGGYVERLFNNVELAADEDGLVRRPLGDVAIAQMLENINNRQKITDAPSWSNGRTNLYRDPSYAMTSQDFREYLGHELAHSEEFINGIEGPVQLLATGVDRYERGNEGRAVLIEQILNDKLETFSESARWREILCRHLAVSLGSGLANGATMNFAQNYAVINAINTFYGYRDSTDVAGVPKQADEDTFSLLAAVYKGTDGTGNGGVYRRPMIYLEGNIDVWEQDSPTIQSGERGKFDVSNKRHTDFVAKITELSN